MMNKNRTLHRIKQTALCAALTLAAASASAIEAWPVDALVKVLHDFTKPAKPDNKVFVALARAETEAGQVAFRSDAQAPLEVSATAAPLRSDSGATIENVKAQFLNYHSVKSAQWPAGATTEFIKHPSEFPIVAPDAFSPNPAVILEPGKTRSLWIIVETKPDTPPGIYKGSITLESDEGKLEIPVEAQVFDAVVPAKRSLKIYNWLFWNGFTDKRQGWGQLRNRLGSPEWGEEAWAFIEQIAANMVAHRQNMFTVPLFYNVLLGPDVRSLKVVWTKHDPNAEKPGILANGLMGKRDPNDRDDEDDERNVFERECEYDFSLFDRATEIFLKHDPDGIIVGGFLGMFGAMGSEITPGSGDHYMSSPQIPIFNSAGEQVDMLPRMDTGDIRYIGFLKAFLPALVKHLKDKGWMDNFMMGLCDETFPLLGKARVLLANEVRKFAPEIKYNDANRETARNVGSLNLWFPLPSHLECYIDFYRERQKAGEEVGYYTCVTPGGYNMNRFVDFPLVKTRLLHWHNYRFGTTGFLHWGYNPWIPLADTPDVEANGDFNAVYRDEKWNLCSSIRQAAQRDGIEDYELLKVVEAKDPEAAQKICAAIVTDCREYTRDVPRFREVRELLLAAAGTAAIDSALKEKIMALEPDHFTLLKDMPRDAKLDDKGWELVYQREKFAPEDLGTDWIATSGKWAVENGALVKLDRSDGHVFFVKGAGRDQHLEFTAWSDLPYPNDLTALLCAALKKETKTVQGEQQDVWTGSYDTAYLFGFGGEGNAFSKFMVRGVEFRVMPKTIAPGKKHRIVCRREGKRVTHIIDGEVILDAETMDTLDGPDNVCPGFYFFDIGRASDVKIYTKK